MAFLGIFPKSKLITASHIPFDLLIPTNKELSPKCERFCSSVFSPTYPVPDLLAKISLKNSSSSSHVLTFTMGANGDLYPVVLLTARMV